MVSVTINSVNTEFSNVSYAFPDNTGCVQTALTLRAPRSIINAAAFDKVPAVSQISSISTMSWSVTSPINVMASISFARLRRLSHITTSALKNFAKVRARYDPPISGDAMVSAFKPRLLIYGTNITEASKWSTGISKKPCICAACRSIVMMRLTPAATNIFATSFEPMATRGLSFLSCRANPK